MRVTGDLCLLERSDPHAPYDVNLLKNRVVDDVVQLLAARRGLAIARRMAYRRFITLAVSEQDVPMSVAPK
jgi:hypothetical protein